MQRVSSLQLMGDVSRMSFPMYVVPAVKLLGMTTVQAHEDLKACGDMRRH